MGTAAPYNYRFGTLGVGEPGKDLMKVESVE